MNKKSFVFFLFYCVLAFSSEEKINNFNYYFVTSPDCELAIPSMLKINATHLQDKGLRFFYIDGNLNFKKILITQREKDSLEKIKNLAKTTGLHFVEERKISFLTLLKYQTDEFMGRKANRFFLIGKSFVFSYGGGTNEEIEYIIDHCLETAKKG